MNSFLLIIISIAIISIIVILALSLIAWSAKQTLFKGQAVWSGKKIDIKRNKISNYTQKNKKGSNSTLLRNIVEQTNDYLNSDEKKH